HQVAGEAGELEHQHGQVAFLPNALEHRIERGAVQLPALLVRVLVDRHDLAAVAGRVLATGANLHFDGQRLVGVAADGLSGVNAKPFTRHSPGRLPRPSAGCCGRTPPTLTESRA